MKTAHKHPNPMRLELLHETGRVLPPPSITMEGTWRAFLQDGRSFYGFLPYYLRCAVPGIAVVPDGRTGWVVKRQGRTFRLRVLGPKGIAFSPSRARGTGRHIAPKHFRSAFGEVDGFITAEFVAPGYKIRLWRVTIEEVWRCYTDKLMTTTGVVSRDKLHFEFDPLERIA